MVKRISRRRFVKGSAAGGVGFWLASRTLRSAAGSANERLNIGVIGCGGKGYSDMLGCASENIVALCDVDEKRGGGAFEKYHDAKRYQDYRRMLDAERGLDAVIVSTPDHNHAAASVMAMRLGKHVYCQKPLTHSVHEARVMRQVAAETGVATQMGNQGHSFDGTRRIVELVRGGAIGPVHEAHVWTDRPGTYWKQPLARRPDGTADPAPGPAKGPTSASPGWQADRSADPHDWRAWWDFGTGALGDMGCHVMDAAFWSLGLESPDWVEAESSPVHPESGPAWEIITYHFPARGEQPAVTLKWYDSGKQPAAELIGAGPLPGTGSALIGAKGTLYIPDAYGQQFELLPRETYAGYEGPAPSLPRAGDPYTEWLAACKGGPAALSNFDYAGPLTETVLLGNVAVRTGQRIEWDPANLRTNDPQADRLLRRDYRKGWTLS